MDPLCLRGGGRGKKNIAREPPLKDGCILHGGLWTPQGGRGPPDEKKRVEEKRRGNKTARTGDAEADAADERRVGGHVTQVGAGIGEARRSQQQRPAVGVGEFDAGAAAVDAVARLAHRQQLQVVRPLAHPRHLGPASKNGDSSKKKKIRLDCSMQTSSIFLYAEMEIDGMEKPTRWRGQVAHHFWRPQRHSWLMRARSGERSSESTSARPVDLRHSTDRQAAVENPLREMAAGTSPDVTGGVNSLR